VELTGQKRTKSHSCYQHRANNSCQNDVNHRLPWSRNEVLMLP